MGIFNALFLILVVQLVPPHQCKDFLLYKTIKAFKDQE